MNLKDNLKKIRKDNNLSQEQLAEMLGVSRQSVSKWEQGLAYPEMDKVIQICQMFNLNIDELLNQDIKQVKETKESKSNINKFMDDFLGFITKTFDMFSSMKLKSKLKCLFEQIIIILLLTIFFFVFKIIFNIILDKIFNSFDYIGHFGYFLYNIIDAFYILIYLILGTLIFLHVFKIRYLDYYVVIKNKNFDNKTQEISKDSSENEKLYDNKKETIIIRDPEHSEYRFIKGLLKLILFIFKCFLIFITLFLLFILVFQFIAFVLSFLIIKTGLFFIGCFIFIITTIFLNLLLLYIIYNLIFNKRINRFKTIIMFVMSIIIIGISIGIMILSIKDFNYIRDLESKYYLTDSMIVPMRDDILFSDYYDIEFIESDLFNDLNIICKHSKDYKFEINYIGDGSVHFSIYQDDSNLISYLRGIIKDFNNKIIVDNSIYKIYIYTTKENIEKIRENRKNAYESSQAIYDEIEILEDRINEYEEQVDNLNEKLQEKQDKVNELEQIIENYIKQK